MGKYCFSIVELHGLPHVQVMIEQTLMEQLRGRASAAIPLDDILRTIDHGLPDGTDGEVLTLALSRDECASVMIALHHGIEHCILADTREDVRNVKERVFALLERAKKGRHGNR